MKNKKYTLLFALAVACSTAHAQDVFRNFALVEATSAPATTAPSLGGDLFSNSVPISTMAAPVTPKDVQNAPVAHTLFSKGEDVTTTRPAYEGRARRRSAPAQQASSAKGGTVETAPPVEVADTATQLAFAVDAGYFSKYFYHGLDQIGNSSIGADTSGVMLSGVSAAWQGLALGYKYALATDETAPQFAKSILDQESYSEHIFESGYTVGVLPQGWLDMSASYQYIVFGEDTFWKCDAQGRSMLKAEMSHFQWFRPSVAYYIFDGINEATINPPNIGNSLLDGEQLILQIEGGGKIYQYDKVSLGVNYYAQAALDNDYNQVSNFNEVNYYQAGVSFPVVYQNVTVAPSIHWNKYVGNGEDTWAGIQATYRF